MKAAFESLLNLDRVVHEPARLVILTVLAQADEVEFRFLEEVSGLTKGNLSSHISKLEEAWYLVVKKFFRGKFPATSLKITPSGRRAFKTYRRQINQALHEKA